MATKIRLRRMGRKKKPFYRVVVIDSRDRRDGKYIESLGTYDPVSLPTQIKIDEAKTLEWLKKGAIPSDTVKNLFRRSGIALKWHLIRMGAEEKVISEEGQKFQMSQQSKAERVKPKKKAKAAQAAVKPADGSASATPPDDGKH